MNSVALHAKRAGRLWLAGFREACAIHRIVPLYFSSWMLVIRTGQCFLLNGLIFLGSLFTLKSFVVPILLWMLPAQCEETSVQSFCSYKAALGFYSSLRSILIHLLYIFWFYPLYIFSFILSSLWYNDIAKHGFDTVKKRGTFLEDSLDTNVFLDSQSSKRRAGGLEGVILGIGEQLYSILLLSLFFIEVSLAGYIPYIGKAMNFLLLSWVYAYYCFEYKWNLFEVSLEKRLDFFELNWAFFAGFGSPCVIPTLFFSSIVSYGVMAILFPLFVLTAAGTQEEHVINSVWGAGGPAKIQIFYFANKLSMLLLQFFPNSEKGH